MTSSDSAGGAPSRKLLVTGLAVCALGSTGVLGWVLRSPFLLIFGSGGSPMMFNTALCLALLGAALLAIRSQRRGLTAGAGAAVSLVAALSFLQYLLKQSLGIDELLWRQSWLLPDSLTPGRMAPDTAVALTVAGLALVWIAWLPTARRTICVLAALIGSVAIFVLCGFVFGLQSAFRWGGSSGMALSTATALLGVSFGLLTAAMHGLPARVKSRLRSLAFYTAAASTVTIVGLLATVSNRKAADTARQGMRAQAMLSAFNHVELCMMRMEAAERGYLLTSDEQFAEALTEMEAHARRALATAAPLVLGEASLMADFQTLNLMVRERARAFAAAVDQRRAGAAVVPDHDDVEAMAEFQKHVDAMEGRERRMLDAWSEEMRRRGTDTNGVIFLGMGLVFGFVVTAMALAHRAEQARQAAEGELSRAHASLDQLARLQRGVLDGTVFAIVATEPDGTISEFNAGAEAMLGYTRDEVVGRLSPAIFHEAGEIAGRAAELSSEQGREVKPGFEVFVAKARAGGADEREWTYVRKDGRRLPVRLSVTALRDEGGEVTGFLGVAQDLTSGREAEAALRASEDRFRQLVANVRDYAIFLLDPEGRVMTWNAGAERIKGYVTDEIVNRHFSIFFTAEDFATGKPERILTEALARGRVEEEGWLAREDGARFWAHMVVTPLRDSTGSLLGFTKITRDITERRAAEMALRASEERFRSAFEHSGIGMAIIGLEGHWLRVNQAICAIVGYSERELLAKTFQDITHPDDLDADLGHVRDLLAGRLRSYQMEKRYFHRDGHEVWVRLTVSLVRDGAGAPVHFVSQIQDITEPIRLERELRTARDQALEVSRLKSAFLATMSHEIRTPMNGIIGMTNLLLETPLSEEQREMNRVVLGSADSLLHVINDILDFSKIEAGKLRIEATEFELRPVVDETLALLAVRAHEKRLELTSDFDPALELLLTGDAGRVRQVLTNLLGNAIKFTDRGAVAVSTRIVSRAAGRARVRFEVRDTGIGIAAAAQTRLFQPFVQVDDSTTRRFGGTGLGLAVSRQLVELMGGTIGCESELERGSLFWFEVEFAARAVADRTPEVADGVSKVLVVDPRVDQSEALLRNLGLCGLRAEAVVSGPEALVRLRAAAADGAPFDLAVVEWQLPAMTGLQLAFEIRTDATLADLPIVMVSATGAIDDPASATAIGIDAFLTRPVREDALRRCVERVLGAAREKASRISPAKKGGAVGAGRKLRLLVAEDNPANQTVARMMLSRMGHEVDVAGNGEQALVRLTEQPYDAVFMDCQMPVLDGFEAARRIRAGIPGINASVPIIAVTAYAQEEDRSKCFAAGMNAYVAKPVRAPDIREALARCDLLTRDDEPASFGSASTVVEAEEIDLAAWEVLRKLPGRTGPSLLPEMIATFVAEEPGRRAACHRHAEARLGAVLAEAAHHFAGSCTSIGARPLAEIALELERAGREENWAEVGALLTQLDLASVRLRRALKGMNLPVP